MKHLLFGLCALGVVGGVAAATVTTNDNVVTVSVPKDDTYTYGWEVASPVVDVVKTGTGTVKFTVASAGYATRGRSTSTRASRTSRSSTPTARGRLPSRTAHR